MNKFLKINKQKNNFNKGFSIMEIIIYFALLAVISTLVTTNIIALFKNYNIVRSNQEIEYNAINIIDKLTRDTRDAQSINISDSSFSVAQGSVSLRIASSTNQTSSSSVRFYLNNNKVKYMKDGVDFGNISTNDVNVSNFRIFYINSSSTEAIKVELTLDTIPHLNSTSIYKNFYTTIQLRE
jgi:type II secretory pathway pseudopilin PulG